MGKRLSYWEQMAQTETELKEASEREAMLASQVWEAQGNLRHQRKTYVATDSDMIALAEEDYDAVKEEVPAEADDSFTSDYTSKDFDDAEPEFEPEPEPIPFWKLVLMIVIGIPVGIPVLIAGSAVITVAVSVVFLASVAVTLLMLLLSVGGFSLIVYAFMLIISDIPMALMCFGSGAALLALGLFTFLLVRLMFNRALAGTSSLYGSFFGLVFRKGGKA